MTTTTVPDLPGSAVVSRDRLRRALFDHPLPTSDIEEGVLTAILRKALHDTLGAGMQVEFTDRAATDADLTGYAQLAAAYGVTLPGLPPAPEPVVYSPDPSLPWAWIFDLDGTVFLNESGRGWYDMTRVDEDSENPPVAAVLRALAATGEPFIAVTGRTEDGLAGSLACFDRHNLPRPVHIYGKPAGSVPGQIADEEFKRQVFLSEIAPKYRIRGVFEDRNVVVDMWRQLGLTCFHVADADF